MVEENFWSLLLCQHHEAIADSAVDRSGPIRRGVSMVIEDFNEHDPPADVNSSMLAGGDGRGGMCIIHGLYCSSGLPIQ